MPKPSPGPSSKGQNCRWAPRRPLYCLNYDLMSDVSVTFMCVPRSPARHCGRDAAPPPAPLSGAAPPRPPDRRGVPRCAQARTAAQAHCGARTTEATPGPGLQGSEGAGPGASRGSGVQEPILCRRTNDLCVKDFSLEIQGFQRVSYFLDTLLFQG